MLPRATNTRGDRESVRGKIGGRTHEISRLIGRSLRAVIDYKALGENTVVLDCDVLQADGGTRTAAITGAYVALADAITWAQGKKLIKAGRQPLTGTVAAVSVGIVGGVPLLDLCYEEDVTRRDRHERRLHRRRPLRRGPGHRRGRALRPRGAQRPARPRRRGLHRPRRASSARHSSTVTREGKGTPRTGATRATAPAAPASVRIRAHGTEPCARPRPGRTGPTGRDRSMAARRRPPHRTVAATAAPSR